MIVRALERSDMGLVLPLAWRGLGEFAEGVSVAAIWQFMLNCVERNDHHAAVADGDEGLVGYVGMVRAPRPWGPGNQVSVVAWYAERPGAGMALLREAERWAAGDQILVLVNPGADERLARVMARRGYVTMGAFVRRN